MYLRAPSSECTAKFQHAMGMLRNSCAPQLRMRAATPSRKLARGLPSTKYNVRKPRLSRSPAALSSSSSIALQAGNAPVTTVSAGASSLVWCEKEELLASMFQFSNLPARHQQGKEHIEQYQDILRRCIPYATSHLPEGAAKSTKAAMGMLCSSDSMYWYPKYGCAVMVMKQDKAECGIQLQPDMADLYIICLDDWQHHLHSTNSAVQHTAVCNDSKCLFVGRTATEHVKSVMQSTDKRLQSGLKAKREKNKKGHQNTPAFVLAVLKAVMSDRSADMVALGANVEVNEDAIEIPQAAGGFTDVGQHTGSQPRDTAWPLVQQVFKVSLMINNSTSGARYQLVYDKCMALLDTWLLQRQCELLTPATATPVMITACMLMLRSAAEASKLAYEEHDMSHVEKACLQARAKIEECAAQRQLQVAQQFKLPHITDARSITYSLPTGRIPDVFDCKTQASNIEEVRQRAINNLGSLPLLPEKASFTHCLSILKSKIWSSESGGGNAARDLVLQHRLKMVEQLVYKVSKTGFDHDQTKSVHGFSFAALGEIQALQELLDGYITDLDTLLPLPAANELMRVELCSRRTLVAYCCYCIMYEAACIQHPLAKEYGAALNWKDLRHLILSDKDCEATALAVAKYLKLKSKPGSELFSLRIPDATFRFAQTYAGSHASIKEILSAQHTAAKARLDAHWAEVQRKQGEARRLRSEIAICEKELSGLKAEQSRLERKHSDYQVWSAYRGCYVYDRHPEVQAVCNRVSLKESQISDLESQLKDVLKAPTPVIQPLPEQHNLALKWLFFLHMDEVAPHLRYLSRVSFLAQQLLLLPLDEATKSQYGVKGYETTLASHYNSFQDNTTWHTPPRVFKGLDGAVKLKSHGKLPDNKELTPSSVDDMHGPTYGVWYPDSLFPEMAWHGVGVAPAGFPSTFNPFNVQAAHQTALVKVYTEVLNTEPSLQRFMECYDANEVALDRGNIAIADQASKPDWLSKPGFLDITRLRSYPCTQLRVLCSILHNKHVPLDQPAVRTMIKQVMYHLGELVSNDKGSISRRWRTGWHQPSDVLPALLHELQVLADELKDKPREHEAVHLLGEVAAYLSDYDSKFRPVAKTFAAMTASEASHLNAAIDRLEDTKDSQSTDNEATEMQQRAVAQLKAKQIIWRGMSLGCYAAGSLDVQDAGHMLELMVLLNHSHVFLDLDHQLDQQQKIENTMVNAQRVMTSRVADITAAISESPGILTAAVRCVLGDRTPNKKLQWRQQTVVTTQRIPLSGFHAEHDGHVYSINILDGTILLDGNPPSRLPKDITGHPLYLRTFGDINFEVFMTKDGTLQTCKPINSKEGGSPRHYDFSLVQSSQGEKHLVIKELDMQHGVQLELLDVGEDATCSGWGSNLPPRLRQLHSHWICREKRAILLRPIHFQQRSTQFLILYAAPDKGTGNGEGPNALLDCRRVLPHLQNVQWTKLLAETALTVRLVRLPDTPSSAASTVLRVLSKFEPADYIHVHAPAAAPFALPADNNNRTQLYFELPRYGLGFELTTTGQLRSLQYTGYQLSRNQQLVQERDDGVLYTLPEFQQYLVLEHSNDGASAAKDVIVLVPQGKILQSASDGVKVDISNACGATHTVHAYRVNQRFGNLTANSIAARLQLANLYAATSTLLPEPASNMTGSQMAMQLVRQSWTSRPLLPAEAEQLRTLSGRAGHYAAALPLLVHELECSSQQLSFLPHPGISPVDPAMPHLNSEVASRYMQETSTGIWSTNPRMLLTKGEQTRVLQFAPLPAPEPECIRRELCSFTEIPDIPFGMGLVAEHEDELFSLVCASSSRGHRKPPPYPLTPPSNGQVPLEKMMHDELRDSWNLHHTCQDATQLAANYKDQIDVKQVIVQCQREAMEIYLLQNIQQIPRSKGGFGVSFRLNQLCNQVASVARTDLMRLVLPGGQQLLRHFNPFLSETSRFKLIKSTILWLQLCVLEDRLARLVKLADSGNKRALIKELQCHRIWDVFAHPEWLVFEAEGGMQIRPQQYTVAQHLIDNPGAICQINMGEGKTRVILPMLALHWAKQDGDAIVRLNFLSKLLPEAFDHLHNNVCASVLARKLLVLPYNRDVQITAWHARVMAAACKYMMQDGGMVLMAPEWRNSLLLKRQELWMKAQKGDKDAASAMKAIDDLHALPFMDLIDESDELLHHRFQLIYAVGSSVALPARAERVGAMQAVLRLASNIAVAPKQDAAKVSIHLTEHAAVLEPPCKTHQLSSSAKGKQEVHAGAWSGLRLVRGKALDDETAALRKSLALGLVTKSDAYELRWFRDLDGKSKAAVVEYITNPASEALPDSVNLSEAQTCQVLMLRGLLAFDLLFHALSKRHSVEYGVNRRPNALKRLAVPYRAAHTPAERAEFAQPDISLLLTNLSYYYDGLKPNEFHQVLKVLLTMGSNAQKSHYEEWLRLSRPGIPDDDYVLIDSALKIDTTNAIQVDRMYKYLSHNMAVVDFYLTYCVFPAETSQFPSRLTTTSWHLAYSKHVVGFSGTKDNHFLLPLAVKQSEPDDATELRATDGKMLHLLLQTKEPYIRLQPKDNQPLWQALLDEAIAQDVDAILDCGALLSGAKNRQAAEYIMNRSKHGRFKGVTYYDETHSSFVILSPTGQAWRRNASPIPERDTFVIYDDARCRGADLQLKPGAVGLLTLGPGICKDKVMQAAGRLRMLMHGQQTVRFIGASDVTAKIEQANDLGSNSCRITALHVMIWVMRNTELAIQQGVIEWTAQGADFAVTRNEPHRMIRPEHITVQDLYGDARSNQPAHSVVERVVGSKTKEHGVDNRDNATWYILSTIKKQGMQYGQGFEVMTGKADRAAGADEECERELEKEEEKEQEREREVPKVLHRDEKDWNYGSVVSAASHIDLDAPLILLQKAAAYVIPDSVASLPWSSRVWVTENFIHATQLAATDAFNDYLRPCDFVLVLPNGDAVLVSEREAEYILQCVWSQQKERRNKHAVLLSLCYGQHAHEADAAPLLAASSTSITAIKGACGMQAAQLVSMRVFNGDATFKGPGVETALQQLVCGRKQDVEVLVQMRGKQAQLPRSDLELACGE